MWGSLRLVPMMSQPATYDHDVTVMSQCKHLLMITARTTRMMTIRMIHSLMFCHQSLRFSRVAVRWNMSAFWFRYSVQSGEKVVMCQRTVQR